MINEYNEAGNMLGYYSRKEKISLKELAKAVGISNNYLSNIENGYTIPSLETFTELSVTLGKTPDFFLLGHIREDIVGNIEDSLKLCSKERLNLIYKIVELLKDLNYSDFVI